MIRSTLFIICSKCKQAAVADMLCSLGDELLTGYCLPYGLFRMFRITHVLPKCQGPVATTWAAHFHARRWLAPGLLQCSWQILGSYICGHCMC